ncbi:hypothetical protein D3C81_2165340 [compost metagenome]
MAVQGIKVYQIGEQEAVKRFAQLVNGDLNAMLIALGRVRGCNAFTGKDVVDLADSDNIFADVLQ